MSAAIPAAKEVGWLNRDKTNALYAASPYTSGQSVVRIQFTTTGDPGANGTYFQQRKVTSAGWDFWAAIRDARLWSNGPDFGSDVSAFGTDFALTRTAASFNATTNSVTHNTLGDTSFGFWDDASIQILDGMGGRVTLPVSRHGGLMCDGVGNNGWLWIFTTNPGDSRFQSESQLSLSLVWLRRAVQADADHVEALAFPA